MLPGFSQELMPKGREKESQAKIKRYMTMMDSMTNEGKYLLRIFFFARSLPYTHVRYCSSGIRYGGLLCSSIFILEIKR